MATAAKRVTPPTTVVPAVARRQIAPPEIHTAASNVTDIADAADIVEKTTGEHIQMSEGIPAASTSTDLVTAVVPKKYILTRDDGAVIHYDQGVIEMPEADATHWWSKASGVKIYSPAG